MRMTTIMPLNTGVVTSVSDRLPTVNQPNSDCRSNGKPKLSAAFAAAQPDRGSDRRRQPRRGASRRRQRGSAAAGRRPHARPIANFASHMQNCPRWRRSGQAHPRDMTHSMRQDFLLPVGGGSGEGGGHARFADLHRWRLFFAWRGEREKRHRAKGGQPQTRVRRCLPHHRNRLGSSMLLIPTEARPECGPRHRRVHQSAGGGRGRGLAIRSRHRPSSSVIVARKLQPPHVLAYVATYGGFLSLDRGSIYLRR